LAPLELPSFGSYYDSSDSWCGLHPLQVSLLTRTSLHRRSVVNHSIATLGMYLCASHGIGFAGPSRARLAIKPNLVHFQCHIWHLALRTNNSPPVAPHLPSRTRSFFRFHRTGTPAGWSSTIQGCAHHRRTRARVHTGRFCTNVSSRIPARQETGPPGIFLNTENRPHPPSNLCAQALTGLCLLKQTILVSDDEILKRICTA
jgi:hypothetical protein